MEERYKVCSTCGENLNILFFGILKKSSDGYRSQCKICRRKYYDENILKILNKEKQRYIENAEYFKKCAKEYRDSHKEEVSNCKKKWRLENIEHIKEGRKNYYKNNKKYIDDKNKKYILEHPEKTKQYSQKAYLNNKDKIRATNLRCRKNRINRDPIYKAICGLRSRIGKAFRLFSKNGKTMSCAEYGINFNKIFDKIGPSPGKEYHLDHIIPISLFDLDKPEHVRMCHSENNLQWLKKKDNLEKYNKITPEVFKNVKLVDILWRIGFFVKNPHRIREINISYV